MFNSQTIMKCVQALEIGNPKCVIRLMQSTNGSQTYKVHTEVWESPAGQWGEYRHNGSEYSAKDEYLCETQLAAFIETCLLPMAKQTNALIFVSGANDCTLAAALERIVTPEQARLGDQCPFTVICTAGLFEIYSKSTKEDSIAAQLFKGSPTWQSRNDFITAHMEAHPYKPFQECDITPAASHVLIFEAIDSTAALGVINSAMKNGFDSTFLGALTESLPSIAIQTHHADASVRSIADLVRRNVPVLLLDTRERAFSSLMKPGGIETDLARVAGSFPVLSDEAIRDLEGIKHKAADFQADGFITNAVTELAMESNGELNGKALKALYSTALDILRSEGKMFEAAGIVNTYDSCDLALLISALKFGLRRGDKVDSAVPLYECIARTQEQDNQNKNHKTIPWS